MAERKLSLEEISAQLEFIPGWTLKQGKLHREIEFSDFSEAFAFMTRAALVSEAMNHHPEWWNVYNKVLIDLSTHECAGISARDFVWAKAINKLRA